MQHVVEERFRHPRQTGMLTVIGDLVEDVVVWSATSLRGTDNPATVHRSRGGSAANVAAFAATIVPTRFIGRVGDDAAGRRLVDNLVGHGVDVRVQRGGTTGTVVVLVAADGERTMYPDRGAAAELGPISGDWLAGASLLHIPAYGLLGEASAAALAAAAGAVARAGGIVTVDVSAVSVIEQLGPQKVMAILDELDAAVVLANRDEAAALGLDGRRPADGGLYVIKDGARPTVLVGDSGVARTVHVPVTAAVCDSTGAGDAFAAGFLASWMAGRPPEVAAAAGHRAAAAVLDIPGAGTPV